MHKGGRGKGREEGKKKGREGSGRSKEGRKKSVLLHYSDCFFRLSFINILGSEIGSLKLSSY